MSKNQKQAVGSSEALQAIAVLEKQAKKSSSESVKKILLCAGCNIADLAISHQTAGREAA